MLKTLHDLNRKIEGLDNLGSKTQYLLESINAYLADMDIAKRPKVDVHHFDLLAKLKEAHLEPEQYDSTQGDLRGTSMAKFAILV